MIKVKGMQVAPAELEGCLLNMAEVADACVVAVPHDYCGEMPMAFVVLRPHIAQRVASDVNEADKVKAAIKRVRGDACWG